MHKSMVLIISLLSTLNVWSSVLCCCAVPTFEQEMPACHAPAEPSVPSCHATPNTPGTDDSLNNQCDCGEHLETGPTAVLPSQPQARVNQFILALVPAASPPAWLFAVSQSVSSRDLPPPTTLAYHQPQQATLCRFLI